MQTLKTAALVVLLMTVMFSAYTTMTTPPEPLSEEVSQLVMDMENFGIDDGSPSASLDDFQISDGQVSSGTPAETMDLAPGSPKSKPIGSTPSSEMPFSSTNRTYADLPAPPLTDEDGPSRFTLSDGGLPESNNTSVSRSGTLQRLPSVDPGSTSVTPEAGRNYPSTGSSFAIPAPTQAMDAIAKPAPADAVASAGLKNAIATADRQYAADQRREALATLSLFYETPNLTEAQRKDLLIRLDPLAAEVIYSPEHLLEKPHRVGGNETLIEIAKQYQVPWQLLANVNGIDDPVTIVPGRDLKVVRGPFRADVDTKNRELTLFLGDLYAGRFPIAVGADPQPQPGTYTIQEKKSAKTFYDLSGTPIPPGNPRNPYGSMWIDLGSGMSLHGSPSDLQPTDQGCISVAGNFSRDLFGILSEGSSVTIR